MPPKKEPKKKEQQKRKNIKKPNKTKNTTTKNTTTKKPTTGTTQKIVNTVNVNISKPNRAPRKQPGIKKESISSSVQTGSAFINTFQRAPTFFGSPTDIVRDTVGSEIKNLNDSILRLTNSSINDNNNKNNTKAIELGSMELKDDVGYQSDLGSYISGVSSKINRLTDQELDDELRSRGFRGAGGKHLPKSRATKISALRKLIAAPNKVTKLLTPKNTPKNTPKK